MTLLSSNAPLSDVEHRRQLRRAVIASTIGTAIEWYDFFLYSTVTGLVFAELFFPESDPLTGTLQAFSIYFVGFLARPVGAAIFGHYGDRLGRKASLMATLVLMGVATFLVGLVPTYKEIGIWGAVILTGLRFIQGIGVGGEWGGSVLLAMEWARTDKHRGFITAWPQFGVPVGLFLANLAVLAVSAWSGDDFLNWGWRIPFLLSILLIAVGFYIRRAILETPTFRALQQQNKIERQPMLAVIKEQPREIILSALARMGQQAPFYIFSAFIFTYGTSTLGVSRDFLLQAVLVMSALSLISNLLFGWLSDRFGRKKIYLLGVVLTSLFGFAYFWMLDTRVPAWIFFAVVVSIVPHDLMYGPQAALIAESFRGNLRYSGCSMGYQLASIIAGGPAPLIATALLATYQTGYAIACYMLACGVVSFAATALMTDRTNQSLEDDRY